MVTREETALLLAKISLIDNRNVTPETVHAWHELVQPYTLPELLAALTTFRKTRPGVYLEPGHLIQLVRFERHQDALAHREPPAVQLPAGMTRGELDGKPRRNG